MKPLPPMSDPTLDCWRAWIAGEPPSARCRMSNADLASLILRLDRSEGRLTPAHEVVEAA